ncbi:PKD domain-containing protein [Haloarchaeobius sp. TZWWS8]|uniref:PKD domain-containing protein n=1 Tax=Haloarchaeobius sp. TZWWS8 TaxID=3446121 RepID=UPI003EB82613
MSPQTAGRRTLLATLVGGALGGLGVGRGTGRKKRTRTTARDAVLDRCRGGYRDARAVSVVVRGAVRGASDDDGREQALAGQHRTSVRRYQTVVGRPVTLAISVDRPAGVPLSEPALASCRWRFDDGTGREGRRIVHRFDRPGEFTLSLAARFGNGTTVSRSLRFVAYPLDSLPAPIPRYDVWPSEHFDDGVGVEPGQPITFDASRSSVLDGRIVASEWVFDDGCRSGRVVTREFDDGGPHDCTLRVRAHDGRRGEVQVPLFVGTR